MTEILSTDVKQPINLTKIFSSDWTFWLVEETRDLKLTFKQANVENCGPPRGNKFDLEKGQRSRRRPRHGANWKGLSQWPCKSNINALSLILQKIWARLKFLWQTEGWRDGQTDEWVLMSPAFAKARGTITDPNIPCLNNRTTSNFIGKNIWQ